MKLTMQLGKDMLHHETDAMAQGTRMKKLGMALPFGGGGSSPSLIDIIRPTKSGSKIDPEHFRRNSVGSSGKACRSTTCRPTML
jgi:hypothetical protein